MYVSGIVKDCQFIPVAVYDHEDYDILNSINPINYNSDCNIKYNVNLSVSNCQTISSPTRTAT